MQTARKPIQWPDPPRRPELLPSVEPPPPVNYGLRLFILLIIIGSAAFWWNRTQQQSSNQPAAFLPLRTAQARAGAIEKTLRITGTTSASNFSYITAPRLRGTRSHRGGADLSLSLVKMLPPGARVKKGQVVAEFDRQHMLLRVDDFRANVIQQKNTLRTLQAYLDVRRAQQQQKIARAKAAMEKAELDLRTAPVRSAMAVERFHMNYEEAKARYGEYQRETPWMIESEQAANRRYEIEVIQAENEWKQAQRNADEMIHVAAMDGVLVLQKTFRGTEYREIEEGDTVGSGQTFGEIIDPTDLVVEASVNQADAELVKNGYKARVQFDAFPDLTVPAKVVSVGAMTRAGMRPLYRREIPVRLDLNTTDSRVIPNLSASADVIIESDDEAVIVPRECVFVGPDQKPFAFVETENGWEKRPLELGLASNTEVAVQSGVKEGDRLSAELPPAQRQLAAVTTR